MAKITYEVTPLGVPGASFNGDQFQNEYLGELIGQGASSIFDKMRRGDAQIKRILRLIETVIRGAQFSVLADDPDDEKEVAQATFKNNLLKKWMVYSWQESLGDILSYLTYGFAVFEPYIRTITDPEFGKIQVIHELGFRRQNSIWYWELNSDGTVKAVNQKVTMGPYLKDVWIKGSDILIFTNDKEGNNWEGVSILRSAYGSWKRKQLYLKMDMIGIEKMAIGTPIFYAPDRILSDPAELQRLQAIGQAYTSHQNGYMILPESLKDGGFTIQKGEYDASKVAAAIDRENMEMIDSIMGSFLDIGSKRAGGNEQTGALISLFMDSIGSVATYIAERLDPLLHAVYVLNFGEPEKKLCLTASGINKRDAKEYAEIIKIYTEAGYLSPSPDIEQIIRADLDLPPMEESEEVEEEPEESEEPEETEESAEPAEPDGQGELFERNFGQVHFEESREKTEWEESINFQSIEQDFDSAEKEYAKIINDWLPKMQAKYLADLKSALKQSNKIKAVGAIEMGYAGQMASELTKFLKDTVRMGRDQAIGELKTFSAEESSATLQDTETAIMQALAIKAKASVANISNRLKAIAESIAINMVIDDQSDETVISATDAAMTKAISDPIMTASEGALVPEAINGGRNIEFRKRLGDIEAFQFSAILDSRTTNICRSLDKQTFVYGEESSMEWRPPLHFRCRSILIPIRKGADVEITGLKPGPIEKGGKTIPVEEVVSQRQF